MNILQDTRISICLQAVLIIAHWPVINHLLGLCNDKVLGFVVLSSQYISLYCRSNVIHMYDTGQTSHYIYPPGNHYASHFLKCPISGNNHLLTTGTGDPSLAGTWTIIKVSGDRYQWLAGACDLKIGLFRSG